MESSYISELATYYNFILTDMENYSISKNIIVFNNLLALQIIVMDLRGERGGGLQQDTSFINFI